jgi:hypothetical protein
MALNLLKDKGVPLARQRFTWKELVQRPFSKLDDNAFTRVHVILMNGSESEALRFSHACARKNQDLLQALAQMRRVEQYQQTHVHWLNPADQSPLETTIGFEQVAIEVTASVAESELDPYLAQVYRFGLLEDFDHMYRYAALMDRVEGKDANTLVQSYADILPGRPIASTHGRCDRGQGRCAAFERSIATPPSTTCARCCTSHTSRGLCGRPANRLLRVRGMLSARPIFIELDSCSPAVV